MILENHHNDFFILSQSFSELHRQSECRHQIATFHLDRFQAIALLFLRGVRIDNLSGTDPRIRLFQTAVEHILYVDIEAQTPFLEIKVLVQTRSTCAKLE